MCTLDLCDRTGRNKDGGGLCEAHYYQQRRGRPFAPIQLRTGSAGDLCDADGCRSGRLRGRFCPKHAARVARHGDASVVIQPDERRMPFGPANPSWTDEPGYQTVHQRIYRARGPASDQTCPCGEPARHWAYTGPRSGGRPFSADLSHYVAMCVACHHEHDGTGKGSKRGS